MNRFPLILGCVAMLFLGGCQTTNSGNFVTGNVDQETVARDAAAQLTKIYPPAKTRFEFTQDAKDAFGSALIQNLRAEGYALKAYSATDTALNAGKATAQSIKKEGYDLFDVREDAVQAADWGVPLGYIFDVSHDQIYVLRLTVGQESLARAYAEKNGSLVPAGYWVRREK